MAGRTKKITTSLVLTVAVSDLACQGAPPLPAEVVVEVPSSPSASASVPAALAIAPPTEEQVTSLLERYALSELEPARRVLYTWTTQEQIEALERDKTLLTRSVSPVHGPAYFDRVVADLATRKDRIAELLRTPAFAKSRFAWHAPWATLLGWPGESYGKELIGVTLKREALLLVLHERAVLGPAPHFTAVDMASHPVGLDEVMKHPERVAAVYFTHDPTPDKPGCGTYPEVAGPAYREFVLVNEAMIERWEIRSPALAEELLSEAAAVESMARFLDASAMIPHLMSWGCEMKIGPWQGHKAKGALGNYEASLAFASDLYVPKGPALHKLAAELRAVAEAIKAKKATSHAPTMVFPTASASAPPRPPPPPKAPMKKRRGTF